MERSPYLAAALQALDQPPPKPREPLLTPQQLAQIAKDRKAFEAANPGQSYMAHGLKSAGQSLLDAPRNAVSGFAELARRLAPGP